MKVGKVYYDDNVPINIVLREMCLTSKNPNQEVCETVVAHILFKAGLMEDGMLIGQYDAAFNAYVETNDLIAALVQEGLLE